jgi:hypothetical protein
MQELRSSWASCHRCERVDLEYAWRGQAAGAERTAGGYYMNAAQAGEAPGRWFGAGASALGLAEGRRVERLVYDRMFGQEHR